MSEKKRDLIWILVVLVELIGILPVLMWGLGGGYMSGMMGMMGYGSGFMFLIPIVFLVLVGVGAYYLVTESTRNGRSESGHDKSALEVLKERYAQGEITRKRFLKMKEELES